MKLDGFMLITAQKWLTAQTANIAIPQTLQWFHYLLAMEDCELVLSIPAPQ
jgi:hypothetical protein